MAVPLKLNGLYYKSHLIEQEELVKNHPGKYLLIDISNATSEKIIYFKSGKYVITDFEIYKEALLEFGAEVTDKIYQTGSINHYEIFIRGMADILGDTTYQSDCQAGHRPSEICYYTKYRNSDHIFVNEEKCESVIFPIRNRHLPNLRAHFLQEKFNDFYSAGYKSPIILDGSVALYISELQRNASIILFLSEDFLKN